MKFTCDTCQARYQIPDEKVAGRKLKYVCRKCDTALILDGTSIVLPAAAPGVDAPKPAASTAPEERASFAPVSLPPGPPSEPAPAPARPIAIPQALRAAPPPALPSLPSLPSPVAAPTSSRPSSGPKPPELPIWHVAIAGEPQGPMRLSEVRAHLDAGRVEAHSLAWRDGQPDWLPLAEIPALAALLAPVEPVAPVVVAKAASLPPPRASVPPPRASVPPPRASEPPAGAVPVPPPSASVPPPRASVPPPRASVPPPRASAPPPRVSVPPDEASTAMPDEASPSVARDSTPPPAATASASSAPAREAAAEAAPIPTLKLEPGALDAPLDAAALPGARRTSPLVFVVAFVLLAALVGAAFVVMRSKPSSDTPARDVATQPAEDDPPPPAAAIADNSLTEVGDDDALANALAGVVDAGATPPSSGREVRDPVPPTGRRVDVPRGDAPSQTVGATETPTTTAPSAGGASRGELTRDAIRAVYQRNQGRVQSCYDRAATMAGNAPDARLQVAVSILPSGQVGRVTVSGNDFGGLGACIQRVVQTWQFPESDQGAQTTFPFVFSGM